MKGLISEEELLSVLDKYDFEDEQFDGFYVEEEKDDDYEE